MVLCTATEPSLGFKHIELSASLLWRRREEVLRGKIAVAFAHLFDIILGFIKHELE